MDQNKLPSDDELDLASIIREFSGPEPDEAEIVPAPPAEESPMPSPITEEPFMDDDFREAFGEGESLEEVFRPEPPSEPSQEAVSDATCAVIEEDKFVEKGRPKKTGGYGLLGLPHLAAAAIWIALILGFGVMLGNWAWVCASDVLALGRQPITASVTIEQEDLDDIPAIAEKLKDAGLIKYPSLFKLYADITNAQEKIKAGTYQFTATNSDGETIVYDYMALMSVLSPRGNRLEIVEDLRIPEGYTSAQIFKLLEEKGVCKAADLEAYVASLHLPENEGEEPDPITQYWFLEGVTWGDKYSLEGYLFPDTYDFYKNDDPQRVVKKMLDAFNASFTEFMRDKLTKVEGYTIRDIIIIASMVEKEAANNSESFTVSSVIYNRLNNSANFPYLNIDATIVYALGGKSELTDEDMKVDSPYNTYINKGLPPGPISSPSQNSIAAALTPEETKYYYYAYDPATKEHHFSKTYQEHQAFLDSLKEEQ